MNGVDYNEVIISGNINVIKDINELIVTVWWFCLSGCDENVHLGVMILSLLI